MWFWYQARPYKNGFLYFEPAAHVAMPFTTLTKQGSNAIQEELANLFSRPSRWNTGAFTLELHLHQNFYTKHLRSCSKEGQRVRVRKIGIRETFAWDGPCARALNPCGLNAA